MKKTGIFYGSTTGMTEEVAKAIAEKLGVSSADIYDVSNISADKVSPYELLILGTSTWGAGELQDDWYSAIKILKGCDLTDKEIALFGCGDSESYSDTFCDGIGLLYDELKESGARFVGNKVDISDYRFTSSFAVVDGKFVGLPIDEINESEKTSERIENWLKGINS